MPRFDSIERLAEHILRNPAAVPELMAEVNTIMTQEAKRLEEILKRHVAAYYNSHTPVSNGWGWRRTYDTLNSISVKPVAVNGNEFEVEVYFSESATKTSLFGGGASFPPILINDGWAWSKRTGSIYRFTHYGGFRFVELAIAEYEATNTYGMTVKRI